MRHPPTPDYLDECTNIALSRLWRVLAEQHLQDGYIDPNNTGEYDDEVTDAEMASGYEPRNSPQTEGSMHLPH